MFEWYVAYDVYGSYLGIYSDYDYAFMIAQMHGGFVLTQTEAWEMEEQEDEDDWDDWEEDKLKKNKFKLFKKNKKGNKKIGYVF